MFLNKLTNLMLDNLFIYIYITMYFIFLCCRRVGRDIYFFSNIPPFDIYGGTAENAHQQNNRKSEKQPPSTYIYIYNDIMNVPVKRFSKSRQPVWKKTTCESSLEDIWRNNWRTSGVSKAKNVELVNDHPHCRVPGFNLP